MPSFLKAKTHAWRDFTLHPEFKRVPARADCINIFASVERFNLRLAFALSPAILAICFGLLNARGVFKHDA